ncbi:MAG: NAD(P)/FAD-dependent oxidoreductase [Syntrophomonadaceae bacterium]|nr:NAD(P)/FAD-dependent oxidoreductase [Syntrophomonadaceae bacterium]
MLEKVDIAIIGAGVVGLAIAYELSRHRGKTIAVVEQNVSFGMETSSRNSQVIHSGIYYPGHFLKTILCLSGREKLYSFCHKYRVDHRRLGKLVIANAGDDLDHLRRLYEQAKANGVEVLPLTNREINQIEPAMRVEEAFFVPQAGIVNSHEFMKRLYLLAKDQGVIFAFCSQLMDVEFNGSEYTIITNRDRFESEWLINSAGLHSDFIPARLGLDIDGLSYRIYPCKGEYYSLRRSFGISHLVYPLPAASGLLGIHITPDLGGHIRLGPNAYDVDSLNYEIDTTYRELFYHSVHRFLPALTLDDIAPDFAGIRPRRQPAGGSLQDFVIKEEGSHGLPQLINLIGIESPGLTSSLAIAEFVSAML